MFDQSYYDATERISWLEMIPDAFICPNGLIAYPDEERYRLRSEVFREIVKAKRSRFLWQSDIAAFSFLLDKFRRVGGYAAIKGNYAAHGYPHTWAYFYLWHADPLPATPQAAISESRVIQKAA